MNENVPDVFQDLFKSLMGDAPVYTHEIPIDTEAVRANLPCPNCGHLIKEHFDPWGAVEFCRNTKDKRKGWKACMCDDVGIYE